ncbi:uncharacterized protein LOC129299082, partial [Prosopis cineraria]|uniref:uncharacterized protein LOC129299082 n=1 Tax=Prosopis cineraria TaxID=364024 RepID=UPI00240ED32A
CRIGWPEMPSSVVETGSNRTVRSIEPPPVEQNGLVQPIEPIWYLTRLNRPILRESALTQKLDPGLLRDSNGNWVIGFTYNLENIPITIDKIKAIKHGLEACKHAHRGNVILSPDSMEALELIYKGTTINQPFYSYIVDLQNSICEQQDLELRYIPQEANICADFLA